MSEALEHGNPWFFGTKAKMNLDQSGTKVEKMSFSNGEDLHLDVTPLIIDGKRSLELKFVTDEHETRTYPSGPSKIIPRKEDETPLIVTIPEKKN